MVVVRCGQVKSTLIKQTGFVFPSDPIVVDDITKKSLMDSQKPVIFYKSLLHLFTVEGEWILNGYSGIGMNTLTLQLLSPFHQIVT